MNSRDILIYLAVKYAGDWEKIYSDVKAHVAVDESEVKQLTSNINSKVITILDENYPELLKLIFRPPFVLFYHGDISLIDCKFSSVAVVGSRRCSKYGAKNTTDIVKELAKDLTIISGMAMGIDSIAHNVALSANGKTIAVLGSGINYVYPTFNTVLYNKIKEKGLILSEYPDNTPPSPKKFPIRNRIVAGLTNTAFIPEAKRLSGTSITASLLVRDGGDICACPERRETDSLCNELIKSGAYLVENAKDILEVMNFQKHEPIFK